MKKCFEAKNVVRDRERKSTQSYRLTCIAFTAFIIVLKRPRQPTQNAIVWRIVGLCDGTQSAASDLKHLEGRHLLDDVFANLAGMAGCGSHNQKTLWREVKLDNLWNKKSPKSTLLTDNTRGLITTKQTKPRPGGWVNGEPWFQLIYKARTTKHKRTNISSWIKLFKEI